MKCKYYVHYQQFGDKLQKCSDHDKALAGCAGIKKLTSSQQALCTSSIPTKKCALTESYNYGVFGMNE